MRWRGIGRMDTLPPPPPILYATMHTCGMEIAIGYVFLLQKYAIIVLSVFGKSSMFFCKWYSVILMVNYIIRKRRGRGREGEVLCKHWFRNPLPTSPLLILPLQPFRRTIQSRVGACNEKNPSHFLNKQKFCPKNIFIPQKNIFLVKTLSLTNLTVNTLVHRIRIW